MKYGQYWRKPRAAALCGGAAVLSLLFPPSAAPQDIRGLEVCTAEKQMERRTGCLQANVELLQQALAKLARETQEKISASSREITAARAEIASLRTTIEKLSRELAQLKAKGEPGAKK